MKKYIYSLWIMLAAVVFTACQDDMEQAGNNVKEGLPAKISLNIEVPVTKEVNNSRAVTAIESEVSDLVLVMIETGSKRVEFVDLSNLLVSSTGPTTNGGRTYNLSADYTSETLSGTYNIYAIANQGSSFANISLDENSAKSMTDEKMQNLIASNSNHFLSVGATTCPMSGTLTAVEIKEETTTKLEIKLTRAVSHIEFTFTNGSSTVDNKTVKANFTPQYYTVYNLPDNGYMIGGKEGNPNTTSYFTSARQSVEGTSFEFMMLENIQTAKSSPAEWTYNEREAWTGTPGSSPADKEFTYAPDKGTFVVVSGTYEDDLYVGEASYTIHLGDFSDNKSFENFKVERNEYHKYNVTVNGVNSITVEAKTGKLTNGAEGELTKKEGVTFILDAHYETVLVKIPTEKVIKTETDEKRNSVKFRTPKGTSTVALSDITDEDDINWIQFAKPNYSNGSYTFPLYKNYTTIKGLIDDINDGDGTETYYQQDGDYYYTVAFVDEFYYEDLELDQFVNVDNRFFIFNPTPVHTSPDGNSIFNSDSGFQIWQRSIKTTYNLSSGMNAFGIETWDETGALEFGLTYKENDNLRGQSNLDGFTNTQNLISLKNNETLTEEILSKVGYIEGVEDNTRESHVWGTFNTEDGTVTNTPVSDAIQACLARNRDLNGNGKIDLDELKWYIPALYQYFIIWLGEELLPGDTRLFPTADFSSTRYTNMMYTYPRLYTSSSNAKRTYWPDQGAAWAVIYNYLGSGKDYWMGNKQALRCCRNLFEQNGDNSISMPAVYVENDNANVIVVSGVEYVRKNLVTDYFSKHTERSTENFLPYKLEVAPLVGTNLYNNIVSSLTIDGLNETADAYNESNQGDSNIKWRVPNQRELMLMVMLGVLPESDTTDDGTRLNYWCTTWFSQESVLTGTKYAKPYPFMYDLADYGYNNAVITLPGGGGTGTNVVRFVRDYTGEIEGLTSSSYDAAYGQGGTGAGVE